MNNLDKRIENILKNNKRLEYRAEEGVFLIRCWNCGKKVTLMGLIVENGELFDESPYCCYFCDCGLHQDEIAINKTSDEQEKQDECVLITIPLEFYADADIDQKTIQKVKKWVDRKLSQDDCGSYDFPIDQVEPNYSFGKVKTVKEIV